MLRLKTNYQQVPLETVRKILEEQNRQGLTSEPIIEQDPGTGTSVLDEDLITEQHQIIASSSEFPRREAYKKS
jgi:hypothetical protein